MTNYDGGEGKILTWIMVKKSMVEKMTMKERRMMMMMMMMKGKRMMMMMESVGWMQTPQ